MKRCWECEKGEHENYDDNVRLFSVIDPDTGKTIMKENLCGEHQAALLDDGFTLKEA